MKQITKNKFWIIVYALLVGLITFWLVGKQKELWEKSMVIVLAEILVIVHILSINRIKYYMLIDDGLIVYHTFSKQRQYSLKEVLRWTENNYQLLGIRTG